MKHKKNKKLWRDILIEKFDRWIAISTPKKINKNPVSWWESESEEIKSKKKVKQ